jgi:hypothetical protein
MIYGHGLRIRVNVVSMIRFMINVQDYGLWLRLNGNEICCSPGDWV